MGCRAAFRQTSGSAGEGTGLCSLADGTTVYVAVYSSPERAVGWLEGIGTAVGDGYAVDSGFWAAQSTTRTDAAREAMAALQEP